MNNNTWVADIEADGYIPTRIWLVICKNPVTKEVRKFRDPDLNPQEFTEFAKNVGTWVFHNGLGYDVPNLLRLGAVPHLDISSVVDTLVCSRTFNFGVEGGHSLAAWGTRLGFPKGSFNDFSKWSEEMETYCLRDVEITEKLYLKLLPWIENDQWKQALKTEHQMASICHELHNNGFPFNIERAKELKDEIDKHLEGLLSSIQVSFPPVPLADKVITPKATKYGTLSVVGLKWWGEDLSVFTAGAPFSRFEWSPFNPGSPKQVVHRLNQAGWKPHEKTKGHVDHLRARTKPSPEKAAKTAHYKEYGWKVSEANLATLPEDAPAGARLLSSWLTLAGRSRTLTEWINSYNPATCSIHGEFFPIGAWTGRMAHAKPNTANITRVKLDKQGHPIFGLAGDYNADLRSLWEAAPETVMVGVDAEGIQLRVLAHLMEDERFTYSVTYGKKEDGTDPHTLNKEALGVVCKNRDASKTFIYSWLLGAGHERTASVLECTIPEGKEAQEKFITFYPGLKALKEKQIPQDAARGYFIGLDNRLVRCYNTHLMLAGYLQNGESVIMKTANVLWRDQLLREHIWFRQVNFVHDEWQTLARPDEAEYVAKVQKDSIRIAGEMLNLRCPMAGSAAIGKNWEQTH